MSDTPPAEFLLRINGHHAAWPGDFYQQPRRDLALHGDTYRRANTSVSLVVRRGEATLLHVLVDAGLGALNSVLEYQQQAGVNRIDALLLTHPHFDHIAGLDWLAAICRRSDVPAQPRPLPLYCTTACYEEAIGRRFTWLKDLYQHRPLPADAPFRIEGLEGAAISVQAMPVVHGPSAPGAVIYRVEWEQAAVRRRIVLAWDLLRLAADADERLLHDADVLLIDSTAWHPPMSRLDSDAGRPQNAWHGTIEEWLAVLPEWQPRRTYWIHYNGYGDTNPHADCPDADWREIRGPLSDEELERHTRREALRLGLDIRVARHGMVIPHDEPWPE